MSFLATSTYLGNLDILEVYAQYNGPRLLSCKNQSGKIFLALWVDEVEDSDLWLYMLVSINRLKRIREGSMCLHQAFSEPETGKLYEVVHEHETNDWNIRQVLASELERDYFPLENTFLHCDPKSLPQIEFQDVIQNAISKTREIVNLILEPCYQYPNEIPSLELGKILCTLQPLVDQLGALANTEKNIRYRDIRKKSEFGVFNTSLGSFQVELASSIFEANVFGNSLAGDAIEKLFELIEIGNNSNALQDFMLQADKKIATRYRNFLEALVSSGTGLSIEWGSPTLTRGGRIRASRRIVGEVLELIKEIEALDKREYEIVGELFKVDKDSWKFGIRELRTEFSYRGDILEQAKAAAGTATISRLYLASIIEIPELNPATNDVKHYYKLANLKPYESPDRQLSLQNLA